MTTTDKLKLTDELLMLADGEIDDEFALIAELRHRYLREQRRQQRREEAERAQKMLDVPKPDLAPMRPIEGKKRTSIDVSCPTCRARAGTPCFRMTSRGVNGTPTDVPLVDGKGGRMYHTTRAKRAKGPLS